MGSATAQHAVGKKHLDSLLGRKGYDDNPGFSAAVASSSQMAHGLKMGAENMHHLVDAHAEGDSARLKARQTDVAGHLERVKSHAEAATTGIAKCMEDTEKLEKQKTKSKKQVAYLLSSGSPLTAEQKDKLKAELHAGEVTVSDKEEKAEQPGSLIFAKSEDGIADDFELVVPLHKVEEEPDGSGG